MKKLNAGALLLMAMLLPAYPMAVHAAETKIPPLDCHKPKVPPKKNPTAAEVKAYNKALPKYRKCIEAYVSARSTAAKKYSKLAQENSKAANKAIDQFNELVNEVSGKK